MNLYMLIRAIFSSIILCFTLASTSYSEIAIPSKEITPFDVIKIQLTALQNNNEPYKDAGIKQSWNFAHPRNKEMTGPLPRFKKMLYDENYVILINHIYHQINLIEQKKICMCLQSVFYQKRIKIMYTFGLFKKFGMEA